MAVFCSRHARLRLRINQPELKFVDGTLTEEGDDFDDVARSVAIQTGL